jgi:hypothetical protein
MFRPASDRGRDTPRRLRSRFTIWIIRSQGATCDACGEAIPPDQAQYEVVISGHEMRLDRDCFRRRMDELT